MRRTRNHRRASAGDCRSTSNATSKCRSMASPTPVSRRSGRITRCAPNCAWAVSSPRPFPHAKSVVAHLEGSCQSEYRLQGHSRPASSHSLAPSPHLRAGQFNGVMHGFLNLACAAALLHSGGSVDEAIGTLQEEDPSAWRCRSGYHSLPQRSRGTARQLRDMRSFFMSFGSCSFTEPISDLEALGWL